jgi:hypothetical protein
MLMPSAPEVAVSSYSAEEIDAEEFVQQWKHMAEVLRAHEEETDDLVSALEGFGKSSMQDDGGGGGGMDES